MLRKKIVYVISWRFSQTDGVTQKTFDQLTEWSKSFDILLIWLQNGKQIPENVRVPSSENLDIQFHYVRSNLFGYRRILKEIVRFEPNYIYTRYPFFHPVIFIIALRFPSIFEINSLEKKEMQINLKKNDTINFRIIYYSVMLTRNLMLKRAKALFFVTSELRDHEDYSICKNKYFVPNGLSLKYFNNLKNITSGQLNLLFIGTKGHAWHGLEKIEKIASLTPEFNYHIVGIDGDDNDNIRYYGELDKNNIRQIMAEMHICIGSLSIHVLGLEQASPLKVREYIAAGFPIIIGYDDAAFPDETPDWVYKMDFDRFNLTEFKEFCIKNRDVVVSPEDKNKYICLENLEKARVRLIKQINAEAGS